MALSDARIVGLIAAAEGSATAFEHFTHECRFAIDEPDIQRGIEGRIVRCSDAVKRCLTYMVSMNKAHVRHCIEIAKTIGHTLRAVRRLNPKGDLEHVLILEELFCEERLGEMYANQADIQVKEWMLQGFLDGDFFDPADWWKQA